MQLRTLLAVTAVLALGVPAAARASAEDVIRDCAQDGVVNGDYSQRELRQAERNLPSDIDEYTDCRQAIVGALEGGNGNTLGVPAGGLPTASGAIAATPEDVAALDALTAEIAKGKAPTIDVGGRSVRPGNAGLGGILAGIAGANDMPAPLVAAVAALLVLAVVTAYLAAREKLPFVRDAALRVLGR